ncbi:hypothetical protein [Sphingomonas psychrotolerans]|uniref:Uncharacterized protein n=1 Tax=Sphingomonas psychrotolerans TaxID=1327635 RepID=A0A2K8MAL9_9SPHN|nr:hypothetical protein [Sphingomonas psychrotolerans]ATY30925.1 hypothetical protein CVN68_02090 [Sphingomonas psychrotolerans]
MIENAGISAADRTELGSLLGLGAPVSGAVFAKALNDPDYARNLALCRNTPAFRDFLLAQAEREAPETAEAMPEFSSLELTAKATRSFWEWARSGFATLDAETVEARFEACLACPNLMAAPDLLAYRVTGADRQRVCRLCGCVAARKTKLPHERCPGADPEREGYNRWGQPLAEDAA